MPTKFMVKPHSISRYNIYCTPFPGNQSPIETSVIRYGVSSVSSSGMTMATLGADDKAIVWQPVTKGEGGERVG